MAADYLEDIRAMQPAGPYSLVGECLGGIVVYEIARQLVAQGQQIGTLVLIDAIRPTFARRCRRRFGIAVNRFLLQNYYWKTLPSHNSLELAFPKRF
jgi:thioesterase domain-containing protein